VIWGLEIWEQQQTQQNKNAFSPCFPIPNQKFPRDVLGFAALVIYAVYKAVSFLSRYFLPQKKPHLFLFYLNQ
jgi:hypothetical protein